MAVGCVLTGMNNIAVQIRYGEVAGTALAFDKARAARG
jgi:hypothetical protein